MSPTTNLELSSGIICKGPLRSGSEIDYKNLFAPHAISFTTKPAYSKIISLSSIFSI